MEPVILDLLDDNTLIRLCYVSRELCRDYLPSRSRNKFGQEVDNISDYVRLLTYLGKVVYGSERFIPFEDAYFRAVLVNDRDLMRYFGSRVNPCTRAVIPVAVRLLRGENVPKEMMMEMGGACEDVFDESFSIFMNTLQLFRTGNIFYNKLDRNSVKTLELIGSVELAHYALSIIDDFFSYLAFAYNASVPFLERLLVIRPHLQQFRQFGLQFQSRGVNPDIIALYT